LIRHGEHATSNASRTIYVVGNAIAEPANLVKIGLLRHSHDGNVSVGSGEIVPINIHEIERVSRTGVERNDENEK
jgi:hypothetical protein